MKQAHIAASLTRFVVVVVVRRLLGLEQNSVDEYLFEYFAVWEFDFGLLFLGCVNYTRAADFG